MSKSLLLGLTTLALLLVSCSRSDEQEAKTPPSQASQEAKTPPSTDQADKLTAAKNT